MDKFIDSKDNKFLKRTPENSDFNQYWYSEKTIQFILNQIQKQGSKRIGLISTPSIFFSLPKEVQDKSYLFDIDDALISKHKNGRKYDFNWTNYDEKFSDLKNTFDFIVIDPPFITEEAWSKFASFAKYLSNDKCKILVSSIAENDEKLKRLLNLNIKAFKPSIPHLVYQYNFFANYDDEELNTKNPEIIE